MFSTIDRIVLFGTYTVGSEVSQPIGALTKWGISKAMIGIGITAVGNCALRALGASITVRIGLLAIPATIGAVGAGATIVGVVGLGVLLCWGAHNRAH